MAKQIILCDSNGNPINTFDPRGDVYVRVNDNETPNNVFADIVSNDSSEYETGSPTLALGNLFFSFGSGATDCNTSDGFDDWSLFTGGGDGSNTPYDYDTDVNKSSGFNHNTGFMSVSPISDNYKMPYSFTKDIGWDIGTGNVDAGNTAFCLIPQGNINPLQIDSNGNITSILVKIPNNLWDRIFTESWVSWQKARQFPNTFLNTGTDLNSLINIERFVLELITGGNMFGNSQFGEVPIMQNLFYMPYSVLFGSKIALGFNLWKVQKSSVGGDAFQTDGYYVDFDSSCTEPPFSSSNIAVKPNINFLTEAPAPQINVSGVCTINDTLGNVTEGELVQGSLMFSVEGDFVGDIDIVVFDSQDNVPNFYENLSNYNEIDDVANYGIVNFTEGAGYTVSNDSGLSVIHITNFSGYDNNIVNINFNYYANELIGSDFQTDDFTFFVELKNFNASGTTYPTAWQDYWDELTTSDRTYKIPSTTITVGSYSNMEYNPSDALIVNPADIIFHLTEQELKYDKNIDVNKIQEARDNHDGWKFAFSLNETIDSKKLLEELSKSSKLIPTFNNNTFSFATIRSVYNYNSTMQTLEEFQDEQISTIKSSDVIKYNISRTPLEDLYTEVEVLYNYDYGMDNYLKTTGKLKINTDYYANAYGITMNYKRFIEEEDNLATPEARNNYYGLSYDKEENVLQHEDTSLTFEAKYIRDEFTANKLAEFLLLFHCNQHNIIEMTLPLKYYNLEVGDLIEFDEMILGKKIYGESYALKDVDEDGNYIDMPIRCGQYILPLFMVTDIAKSIKDVKVKVMQLHYLSNDNMVWDDVVYKSAATNVFGIMGDVNGDGFVDVLDVILMVNIIISTNDDLYVPEADLNQDGSIDILDVVQVMDLILG